MNYQISSTEGTGKEIVTKVLRAEKSQLLVPPKLKNDELEVSSPENKNKHIGLFSSGTTGKPKCVWNLFEHLKRNAIYTSKSFDISSSYKLLILAAPWHVAGLSWAIMAEKLRCSYEFITTRKNDEEAWYKSIIDIKPDYLLTVPAVLRALYYKQWHVPNIVFGGYSIEPNDLELLAAHCEMMYHGYGQTEAGGLIASHKVESSKNPGRFEHLCCGLPIEGVKIRCEGVPENPGHIYIQSQTAFTQKEYDSRDLGFMDEQGRIYVLGRAGKVLNPKKG